jgi:hypothetical protein
MHRSCSSNAVAAISTHACLLPAGLLVVGALRAATLEDVPALHAIAQECGCSWSRDQLQVFFSACMKLIYLSPCKCLLETPVLRMQADILSQIATVLLSHSSPAVEGFIVGWHAGGELQVRAPATSCARGPSCAAPHASTGMHV